MRSRTTLERAMNGMEVPWGEEKLTKMNSIRIYSSLHYSPIMIIDMNSICAIFIGEAV